MTSRSCLKQTGARKENELKKARHRRAVRLPTAGSDSDELGMEEYSIASGMLLMEAKREPSVHNERK